MLGEATTASLPEELSARLQEVWVEPFADESFWARRGRGSSLYFSVKESSTRHTRGDNRPRLSGGARLRSFTSPKGGGASLDRTAEGRLSPRESFREILHTDSGC